MQRRNLVAALLVLCVVSALVVLWQRSSDTGTNNSSEAKAVPSSSALPRSRALPSPAKHPPTASPNGRPPNDALERRAALTAALGRAQTRREHAPPPTSDSTTTGVSIGTDTPQKSTDLTLTNKTGSDTSWDRDQIAVLNQLLGECYDIAKEQDPDLAGTIGLQFTLRGEPEIGGLVENITFVAEHSSIVDPPMRECMQESLYALELDPPDQGTVVERLVTMRFSDDEEEEEE